MKPQNRVIIEAITPQINEGRYAIKRVVGETVNVEADIYADGHDVLQAYLCVKHESQRIWKNILMEDLGNDRWQASFKVEKQGNYEYTVQGWIDHPLNWQHNIERKIKDNQHVNIELLDGIQYLNHLLEHSNQSESQEIKTWVKLFKEEDSYQTALEIAQSEELHALFIKYPLQKFVTEYEQKFKVEVDRHKAIFSTWYEFFPRSASQTVGKHGTFKDCEKLIPRVADLGFDTLYFPPIHPIGIDFRKGKNNTLTPTTEDVGSPWAIGNTEGGHKDIHPELGTLADFKSLVKTAQKYGIEIALDYALQCSPNHPYVKEHPEWFTWRPDGSVQYAENPPKKYQDILPINFETKAWKSLWEELKSILVYWAELGIKVFRVDNPHTKSFLFWEWVIAEVKKKYPETIFLAEAFTRPKVMHQLAKAGFTQSYTYYTWRNSKQELIEYMIEISQGEGKEYFRPNFWPNTPDINPYNLQDGNENLFLTRYFMAATLSSSYGLYGPVYEYIVHQPYPGKEEYLDSEKYEIKHWDWTQESKLTRIIRQVNQWRRENTALQFTNNIKICEIGNDALLAYYKESEDRSNRVLMIVNLDPHKTQNGMVRLPYEQMGIQPQTPLVMHDLISDRSYTWNQEWNYIELSPYQYPYHLFVIKDQQIDLARG